MAFEHLVLYAQTAQKNTGFAKFFVHNLDAVIKAWGTSSDKWRKAQPQDHYQVWRTFTTIHLLRELSRGVFHGSVISDILDGSHHAKLLLNLGRDLTRDLGIDSLAEGAVWGPLEGMLKA